MNWAYGVLCLLAIAGAFVAVLSMEAGWRARIQLWFLPHRYYAARFQKLEAMLGQMAGEVSSMKSYEAELGMELQKLKQSVIESRQSSPSGSDAKPRRQVGWNQFQTAASQLAEKEFKG